MTEPRPEIHVFVRGLTVQAEIGVHGHEQGRRQPLVVDVELEMVRGGWSSIAETVNYEDIGEAARAIAAGGHILLVETFAWRLAQACLADPKVRAVRVRVEKPEAMAPASAGVEIELTREND